MAGFEPLEKFSSLPEDEVQRLEHVEHEAAKLGWKTVALFLVFMTTLAVLAVVLIWGFVSNSNSIAQVALLVVFLLVATALIFCE